MATPDFFFNPHGRLRSGWRLAAFVVMLIIIATILYGSITIGLSLALGLSRDGVAQLFDRLGGYALEKSILLIAATLTGFVCGYVIEDVPWRALGWTLHRGWLKDLALGSVVGFVSLVGCALIASVTGGLRFSFAPTSTLPAVWPTLISSFFIFVLGAAAEEVWFRGYPLQTLLRAWVWWAALIPSSVFFGLVHLLNPNVAPRFTLVNTMLAGVWLAMAYLRTRSLWFPLGVHWAWNWTMGALCGIPVSGITKITPAPLLRATDMGPAWLTGGAYGLEGGAVCTLVLIVSTIFIWRTSLLSATPELKEMTSHEIPQPPTSSLNL